MKVKISLNEISGPLSSGVGVGFGGLSPGYAGTFGNNAGKVLPPSHRAVELPSEDSYITVKVCMHRNNMVLLLKNEKGWDLPGGHLKRGEDPVDGLKREVFEETGLQMGDIEMVGTPTRKKRFFCAPFLSDDVHLSNEHYEYKFFKADEIRNLNDLNEKFKSVILKCLGKEEDIKKITRVRISVKI